EIIRINGTEPPGRSLEKAIETFGNHVAGDVRTVEGDPVTLETDEQGLVKEEQLKPIIARRRDRGPSDISILLIPGLSDVPHRGTCSQEEDGSHWVVIQGKRIDARFKILSAELRWQLVITHELCHAFHVPGNRNHAWSARHCTNPACVLYPRPDARAIGVALLRMGPPMDLCADCRREIREAQQDADGELVDPRQPYDREKWIADLVRLNPQHSGLLSEVYWGSIAAKRYDTAIAYCTVALEDAALEDHAGWYWRRACAHKFKGEPDAAADDLDRMAQAIPDTAEELNYAAWKLSTVKGCDHWRDGAHAVKLATRACELTEWKDANVIDTLAAACAESGEFSRAAELQSRAIALAEPENAAPMEQRLVLYREGKPYREEGK
ncbi:MAG TPA: hypothetical protein VMW52_13510, partial [Phycisphaerae bacterium]|nr:hypothetical protein [Phycisphaerae bacterium]